MPSISITASHLRDLVRPVAPLAANDPTAPALLSKVRLWTGDGYLYASCTDKLVAGIERTPLSSAVPGFDTAVDVHDLGRRLDLVAPRDVARNPRLLVEATPGGLVVHEEPTGAGDPSSTFYLPAVDPAVMPKVVDMVAKIDTAERVPVDQLHLYAHTIARFQTAQRTEPLRFHFTGDKAAILVSAGESFLGVLMPARPAPVRGLVKPNGPNLWADLFGTEAAWFDPPTALELVDRANWNEEARVHIAKTLDNVNGRDIAWKNDEVVSLLLDLVSLLEGRDI